MSCARRDTAQNAVGAALGAGRYARALALLGTAPASAMWDVSERSAHVRRLLAAQKLRAAGRLLAFAKLFHERLGLHELRLDSFAVGARLRNMLPHDAS